MKLKIYAMAIDKQSAKQQIMSVSGPLVEHLIKLYLFTDSQYENHWRKEIWSLFHSVPKLKNSKKFPPESLVREAIGAYDDSIDELCNMIINEYSEMNPDRQDISELSNIVLNYLDWISQLLSRCGTVNTSEVYAKLDELGL